MSPRSPRSKKVKIVAKCPHCGGDSIKAGELPSRPPTQRWKCKSCEKHFKQRKDTVIQEVEIKKDPNDDYVRSITVKIPRDLERLIRNQTNIQQFVVRILREYRDQNKKPKTPAV